METITNTAYSASPDFNHYGVLALTGPRQLTFLQGQLTADINTVTPQQAAFSAYTDHRGRVLASLWIFAYKENYYLLLPRSMLTLIQAELQKYASFSKITLADNTPEWEIIATTDLLDKTNPPLPPNPNSLIIPVPNHRRLTLTPHSQGITAVASSDSPSAVHLAPHALSTIAWRRANIQNIFAEIYPETSQKFTVHMLGYPALGAVSFTKGCFRGQEPTARTEYLGACKRELQIITLNTARHIGDEIKDETNKTEIIGTVIESTEKNPMVLALVRKQAT